MDINLKMIDGEIILRKIGPLNNHKAHQSLSDILYIKQTSKIMLDHRGMWIKLCKSLKKKTLSEVDGCQLRQTARYKHQLTYYK